MKEFKNLKYFFSSYFHQDWDVEGDNISDIIKLFMECETQEIVQDVAIELKGLISKDLPENRLIQLINEFGCFYDPSFEYDNFSDWLKKMHEIFMTLQKNSPVR